MNRTSGESGATKASILKALLTSQMLVVQWLFGPTVMAQQPANPIVVDISQPESEIKGLADVLLGSLGLAGLLLLGAIVAAAVFAGVLFWIRLRFGKDRTETTPHLKI